MQTIQEQKDVIVVFVGNALEEGRELEHATAYAWQVGAESVRGLKYAVPVVHRQSEAGLPIPEPRGVFEVTGYYPTPTGRFAFDLVESDKQVVGDLARMYGPFVYRNSGELFDGVPVPAAPKVRVIEPPLPPRCDRHNLVLPATGLCDDCR